MALWERRGVDPVACTGGIGADPVGAWLSDRSGVDVDAGLATLAAWAPRLAVAPAVRLASIDATRFHDAGASDAQELGYALSTLVADVARARRRGRARRGGRPRPLRGAPRRHRRSVRHDRQVPGRAPAARPPRRGRRRPGSGRRRVVARGHVAGDDHPLRPRRQRAARHGGVLRCGCRRRRRDHRGAVRRARDRRHGDARSAPGAQHPVGAGDGGPPHAGRRPGGRVVVRREPHRPAGRRGVGMLPTGRARRRGARRRRAGGRRRGDRRHPGGARRRPRSPPLPADRSHRVPRRRRSPAPAGRRPRRRSRRQPAATAMG